MKKITLFIPIVLVLGIFAQQRISVEIDGQSQDVEVQYDIPANAKVTYEIPPFGTINMHPVGEPQGWRGTWPAGVKKQKVGPLELQNLVIIAPLQGDTAVQADATLFGKKAHIKSDKFVVDRNGVDMILDITFPHDISIIPGEQVKLHELKYIQTPGKTEELQGKTILGGKKVDIEFDITKTETDAKIILEHGTLADIVPFTKHTPLTDVKITNLTLEVENIFGTGQRPIDISGTVDMSSLKRFGLSGTLDKAQITGYIKKGHQHFSADVNTLEVTGLGEVKNAKIVGDFQAGKKPTLMLQGHIIKHLKDNPLDIFLDAEFGEKELKLEGSIEKPFEFADIKVHDAKIVFKRTDNDITFEVKGFADIHKFGVTYKTRMHISHDTKGVFTAEAYLISDKKIYPFAEFKTPGADDIVLSKPYFKFVESKGGMFDAILAGTINLWGLTLEVETYYKTNQVTGQRGVALRALMPEHWTISTKYPVLKWLDGIKFKDLYLLISSLSYEDLNLDLQFERGFNFYGEALLGGPLKPVDKLTGEKGAEKLSMVIGIAENPLLSQLQVNLPFSLTLKSNKVSVGPLVLQLSGRETGPPSLGLMTNLLVKPSAKDETLDFSTEIQFEETLEGGEWNYSGSMQACWKDPFGVMKGVEVCNLALEGDMSIVGALVGLGIAGTIDVGKEQVTVAAKLDLEQLIGGSGVYGSIKTINLADIIDFVRKSNPKLPQKKSPPFNFENMKLSIAPTPFEIGQFHFPQGTLIKGTLDFLGAKGLGDIAINDLGFKGDFSLSPIKWKLLDIYGKKKVGGKWVKSGGPTLDLDFNILKQEYLLSGILALGDVYQSEFDGLIKWDGFSFKTAGELLGFAAAVTLNGVFAKPDVGVIVEFKQKFVDSISGYVSNNIKSAQNAIKKQFAKSAGPLKSEIRKVSKAQRTVDGWSRKVRSLKHKIKHDKDSTNPIDWAKLPRLGIELVGLESSEGIAKGVLKDYKKTVEGIQKGLLKGSKEVALAAVKDGKIVFKKVMKNFDINSITFSGDVREILSGNFPRLKITGNFFGKHRTFDIGFNFKDVKKSSEKLAEKIVSYLG